MMVMRVGEFNLRAFLCGGVGLGPMVGTLAIIIYSVGMLGKFYSEAVETIDPRVGYLPFSCVDIR